MKTTSLTLLLAALSTAILAGDAGKSPAPGLAPEEPTFGRAILGGKYSEDLQSGYFDAILGLSVDDNHALFLNLRGIADDSNQEVFSAGLGFRVLLEDPGLILGANINYDRIDSAAGNTFDQLGFGAELLSKWVDARFNYYLPEEGAKTISQRREITGESVLPGDTRRLGNRVVRDVVRRTEFTTFNLMEVALEGWNAEVGFLVPGVEKFLELRLFAGAYGYDNPLGGDFDGFKARAEARITRHVTLDLEYWDDRQLVGGKWVAGVRVSHPFDLGALLSGRNPFRSGAPVTDLPSSRDLRSRMDEMVMRSHRVFTTNSQAQPGNTEVVEEVVGQETIVVIPSAPPVPRDEVPK